MIGSELIIDVISDLDRDFSWYHTKKYDIIVCDYTNTTLTDLELELLENIRSTEDPIPIILFITRPTTKILTKLLELRIDVYLQNDKDPQISSRTLNSFIRSLAKKNAYYEQFLYLKTLINTLPYGIVFFDQNRRILYINDNICKIFHFSHTPDNYIGFSDQEFMMFIQKKFIDPEVTLSRIEEMLANNTFSFNTTFILVDGRVLESASIPIYVEQVYYGQLLQIAYVTTLRLAEDKLKNERLELDLFAHEMAHDLRNIFTAIQGYVTLIRNEKNSADLSERTLYTNSILDLVQRAQGFLKQSLELAEAGKIIGKKQEVNLDIMVREVAKLVIPEHITFHCDSLPKVLGDEEKVFQIYKNLLENAVVHGKPTKINVLYQRINGFTVTSISNNGVLLSDATKTNLENETSNGFGFKLVKRLVAAHGWEIKISNTTQTKFEIIIPRELIV